MYNKIRRYAAISANIKELETEKESLRADILEAYGPGVHVVGGKVKYVVKVTESIVCRLDAKAIRKDHPDFINQYGVESKQVKLTIEGVN